MPPPSPPNDGDDGYYDRPEPLGEHAIAWIYVAASSLSILCCVTVLLCHVLAPGLSRFPSSLLLWRVVCDLLLSLHFVLLNSQQLFDTSATDAGVSACTAPLALLAQFGLFGSLSWYACLSANVYLSVTRPFTPPAGRMALYHAWVWTGAALSGVYASAHAGYRSAYHICWTNARPGSPLRNLDNWVLFLGWVVAYASLGVAALLYGQSRLLFGGASLAHRLAPRLQQLRASRLYTLVFTAYWALLGTVYTFMYVRYEVQGYGYERAPRYLFAALLGSVGTVDCACWWGVQATVQPGTLRALRRALCCGARPAVAADDDDAEGGTSGDGDDKHPPPLRQRASTISDETLFGPRADGDDALPSLLEHLGGRAPTAWGAGAGCLDGWRAWRARVEADVRAAAGDEKFADLSDGLRRDFVRYTILGVATSTRTVNAERARADHAFNAAAASRWLSDSLLLADSLPAAQQGVWVGSKRAPAAAPAAAAEGLAALATPLLASSPASSAGASTPGAAGRPASSFRSRSLKGRFAEVHAVEVAPGVLFQDYAPLAWQQLRERVFGVSFTAYLSSLVGECTTAAEIEEQISAMVGNFSEGGGGGFFFFSADRRFLLKSVTQSEKKKVLRMLPDYCEYLKRAPGSLLSRFYGCYSLTMFGQTVHFVVMESLFAGAPPLHEKYDLKGSWVDRHRAGAGPRKDNDLTSSVRLPAAVATRMRAQCAEDVRLLRDLNIMDYSLLLGVHYRARGGGGGGEAAGDDEGTAATAAVEAARPPPRAHPHPHAFAGAEAEYYLCVIDLLQEWDVGKRLERWAKVALCCLWRDRQGMSAVEPDHYARRFLRMIDRLIVRGLLAS